MQVPPKRQGRNCVHSLDFTLNAFLPSATNNNNYVTCPKSLPTFSEHFYYFPSASHSYKLFFKTHISKMFWMYFFCRSVFHFSLGIMLYLYQPGILPVPDFLLFIGGFDKMPVRRSYFPDQLFHF